MNKLIILIFLIIVICFTAWDVFAQPMAADNHSADSLQVKQKADSIANLTIDFQLEALTPAQEAKMKEFDEALAKLQEAFNKLRDEKIKYIIGIIDGQKKPVDQTKIKNYEHKPNVLILRMSK